MKNNKEEVLYSYHTFMFPFRFDKILEEFDDNHEYYKEVSFDERVRDAIDKKFKNSLEKDKWKYKKFNVDTYLDYNEISYFHNFVKDSMFNTKKFEESATSYFFEKEVSKNAKYTIKVLDKDPYELDLIGVTLRIFDTGVAILAFEIKNSKYNKLEDILNINEYGRRLYPQFLSQNFDTSHTKGAFLPEYIKVDEIKEDFEKNYKSNDIQLANFILEILGETFTTQRDKIGKYHILPILDDRMFVLSHILNDAYSYKLKNEDNLPDFWYEYVFIDKLDSKNIQNTLMQKELIEKSTYKRWQKWGTLYGVSRYSFVVMTDTGDFAKNVVLHHMQTMYFQMVTIALANRASILRFSDEVTALSDINDDDKNSIIEKIQNIYKNYLRYKNKLYFKEITPQEQGIELYDKIRDVMRIDCDIKDLSEEITSLYDYAYILQEQEEKEEMGKLTRLGTIFLPGTFIAGILGMNVFPDNLINNICGLVSGLLMTVGLTWWLASKNKLSVKKFITKGVL